MRPKEEFKISRISLTTGQHFYYCFVLKSSFGFECGQELGGIGVDGGQTSEEVIAVP